MKRENTKNTDDYYNIFAISLAEIKAAIKAGKLRAERYVNLIYLRYDGASTQVSAVIKRKLAQQNKHHLRRHKNSFFKNVLSSFFGKRK